MKKKKSHIDLGFAVPAGYFKDTMDRKLDQAMQQSSQSQASFSVPYHYFDALDERIVQSISTHNKHGYSVPSGYFDQLENQVMHQVKQDKAAITGKPAGFNTPSGYFDHLEDRVVDKVMEPRVIQMDSRVPSWVMPMLAVAAAIVALITIDGLWTDTSMSFDDLKDEELELYIAESNFTIDNDAMDILFSDNAALNDTSLEVVPVDNEFLLDYLADEIEMNQMIEE